MSPALHPDAQRLLELIRLSGRKPTDQLEAAEARALYRDGRTVLQLPGAEVSSVQELTAPGPLGPIPLRLYRPLGSDPAAMLPVLVFFHGGGWVIGDLDTHDGVCRGLANASGGAVVSVDYRMAPEHVFPAAIDDAAAAVTFVAEQASALNLDATRLAVGGDSAGGNLAAVMALMARDGTLPAIVYQLLLYPAVDLTASHASYARITDGYPLVTRTVLWFRNHYLPDPTDATDWRASPLRAASLAGTAPALVLTCGHDPLCDEGRDYAERLEREGVPVSRVHLSDQIHGYLTMGRLIRAAGSTVALCGLALRDAWSAG